MNEETYAVIKLSVNHSKLSLVKNEFIVSKNYNSIFMHFNIETDDWADTDITAIFNEEYICVLDDSMTCAIPHEVLDEEGYFEVGLFGIKDGFRINTNQMAFRVWEGSYDEGIPSIDIDKSLYEKVMEELKNKLDSDEISDWAKQPNKPTYSYDEIQGTPKTGKYFLSYQEAIDYAKTDDAYIGQQITVIDEELDTVTVYVVANSKRELSQVGGSSNVGDYQNLTNKPKINGVTLEGDMTDAQLYIDTDALSNSEIESIFKI